MSTPTLRPAFLSPRHAGRYRLSSEGCTHPGRTFPFKSVNRSPILGLLLAISLLSLIFSSCASLAPTSPGATGIIHPSGTTGLRLLSENDEAPGGGAIFEYEASISLPRLSASLAEAASGAQTTVSVEVYVPQSARATTNTAPRQVLVAIHGMGGNGTSFASSLYEFADTHGWVVVAPTFAYGDWTDPEQVRRDATEVLPSLRQIISRLPQATALPIKSKVLLYGFSKGAQIAHRFALLYPEEIAGVVALSAGTYTLPKIRTTKIKGDSQDSQPLNFPYGVADAATLTGRAYSDDRLVGVPFFVGVGTSDARAEDVPRNWDSLLGACRTDRATAFVKELKARGVSVQFEKFAEVGHWEAPEMRQAALSFLAEKAAERT